MAERIFKYPVEATTEQTIMLPRGAKVLHFNCQRNAGFYIWVLVNPDEPPEPRRFLWFGTGHTIDTAPEHLRHIDTILTDDGQRVWHFFEVVPCGK